MYLLNVMRQLLRQVVRHVTILNYVILFCFGSSEPLTLDSVRILVLFPLFCFASSEPLALDPLRILVFLPRCFDFNADVNSMYSADKSTNNIISDSKSCLRGLNWPCSGKNSEFLALFWLVEGTLGIGSK